MPEGYSEVHEKPFEPKENLIIEPFRISPKLALLSASVEHSKSTVEQYNDQIRTLMSDMDIDGVVFEYFPQEIKMAFSKNAVLNHYGSTFTNMGEYMPFFEGVAKIAAELKKEALVFDPAHDEKFSIFRIPTASLFYIGNSFSLAGIIEAIVKQAKFSRRNMFNRIGLSIGGLLASNAIPISADDARKGNYEMFTRVAEDYFRNALVAEGLKQLSQRLEDDPKAEGKKLLLVYPYGHWEGENAVPGIKKFLEDDELRRRELQKFSAF